MTRSAAHLIAVGALSGAHGVRGDVRVRSFTADPYALFGYGPLLDKTGKTLLEPKSVRAAKDHFIVTPVKPKQKEEWDALKGTQLFIDRAKLPNTETDEFYIEDLIGLKAVHPDGAPIGLVKAVQDHGAGDLLEILPADGASSVFVPFTSQDVPDISLADRQITISSFELWADNSPDEPSED